MDNIIEEYVYSIKAEVDTESVNTEVNKIRNIFSKLKDEASKIPGLLGLVNQDSEDGEGSNKTPKKPRFNFDENKELAYLVKTDLMDGIDKIVDYNKMLLDKAEEISDKASDISNTLVSGNTMFVDKDIKDLMTSFGVSNNQALAMKYAMDTMGLSSGDLFQMTQGEAKAFTELLELWNESMSNIDAEGLTQFNQATQEYQLAMAKMDLRKEAAYYQMMAKSAPSLERLYDTQLAITENWIEFIEFLSESDVLNAIIEFTSGALKPLEWAGDAVGSLIENGGKMVATTPVVNFTNLTSVSGVANNAIANEIKNQANFTNTLLTNSLKGVYD